MLAKYSNGWGHLVITLATMTMVSFLLFTNKLDTTACMTILSIVISFWFMSGTVNRFNAPLTPSGTTSNSPLPSISDPSAPAPAPAPAPATTTNAAAPSTAHGG